MLSVAISNSFVYEPNILGTAGGVRNAFKQLNLDGHAMMVMHGDILCDLDLRSFLQTEDFCTLLCEEGRSIEEYQGNVAINGEGKIIELGKFFYQEDRAIKKGFFTGIQLLSQEALRKLSLCDFESLVAEVYPAWLKQNFLVKAQMQYLEYEDVGSIPRLFHANMAMLKSPTSFQHINILEGLRPFGDAPDIYVGKNVSLDPQVKLVGPAIIADGAVLKSNSVVGPKAIVGERAVISEHVLVKNSVVMSDTIVQKMEQLDCVIALSDARVKV